MRGVSNLRGLPEESPYGPTAIRLSLRRGGAPAWAQPVEAARRRPRVWHETSELRVDYQAFAGFAEQSPRPQERIEFLSSEIKCSTC